MTKKIVTRIDDNGLIREYTIDEDNGLLKECEKVKVDGGGLRKNDGKLRTDLIPMSSLRSLSRVLGKGAEKYDDNN